MIIYFYGDEKSLIKNLPSNENVIITEEDIEKVLIDRKRPDKVHTTCSIALNYFQWNKDIGDSIVIYDSTGVFTIVWDGEDYNITPKRTSRELREGHDLEAMWRNGEFNSEVE